MIDVQMGVTDIADVAHSHAMAHQLVLDHVLMELQAAHAERFHDLVGPIAGVHDDRIGPAEDQEAQRQHPPGAAAIAPQHQEARIQLDVAIVQDLDLQRHWSSLAFFMYRAGRRGWRWRRTARRAPARQAAQRHDETHRPARGNWTTISRSENSSRTGSAWHLYPPQRSHAHCR